MIQSNSSRPRRRRRVKPRRCIELFAGIGLMRLGLESAGWRCVFANDNCPKKRRMYEGNFSDDEGVFSPADVRELNADELPTAELVTASFPCTDLSIAGDERKALIAKAGHALWLFVVQRESCGLRDLRQLLRDYHVPAEVHARMGAFPANRTHQSSAR